MDGRTNEEAYAVIKKIKAICLASKTKDEAKTSVKAAFPTQDLDDVLSAFRPFIDIGEQNVRKKLKQQ